jgi:adenylate cyclase
MTGVKIEKDPIESAIAAKLDHDEELEFEPESRIDDVRILRGKYEKLRTAYQLQRQIAFEMELDSLLHKIMDSLFETLQCDRGAIMLLNLKTGEFENHFVKMRDPEEHSSDDISISHTIIDQVVRDKTAILSSDARMDSRFAGAQSIIMQGIRSTMCVPLVAHAKVLGVLHLDSLFTTGAFTESDLNLVQGLSYQAAIAIENSMLVNQREEDVRIREKFSRLLSPVLVDQVVEGRVEIKKGGENRLSTVLFSDLRGFTAMSQRKEPEEIVHMLNEYFEIMVDIVFEHDGTLDKFMGDGIMAVWGSPVDEPNAPIKAVRAGLSMQQALAEFNETRMSEGLEEMNMGIGIDTGHLVAGYMGSTKTMNYTVVGPPVNLAARLCAIAKPTQVLISKNTLAELPNTLNVQTLDAVHLKGISEAVVPYNVIALTDSATTTPR